MKTILATIGFLVVLLWGADQMGIGHFFIFYGGYELRCSKV